MVLTRGDSMADLVERRRLGGTVDFEDDEAFAAACAELLDDSKRMAATAARVRELAPSFRWDEAARPLVDFCREHRERPLPRRHPTAVAMATYGQYPAILANEVLTEGPLPVARRVARNLARALRYGV
jgi:hypothetical protein